MASDETRYTNKIFMAAALPLMKTIATDVPELKKKFEGVNAIYQVSAKVNAEDKEAVHFIIENGEWSVKLGEYLGQEKIDAELAFSSMEKMNEFRFFFASFISICFPQAFHSLIKWATRKFTIGRLKALTVAINGRLKVIRNALHICVLRQASQEQAGENTNVQSRFSV